MELSLYQFAVVAEIWSWLGRHWAALAITGTCISLVIFCMLVLAKYVRIALNIFIDTHPPLAMGPVDFQPLRGEIVRFRSFDGTSLRGMHLRSGVDGAPKGAIVFCHEFGSDMYSCARYVKPLIDAGFDVFSFDFRGHGDSSRGRNYRPLQWPSDKEVEDVLGACAHVESLLSAEGRRPVVGLFGVSRGAGAGLLSAAIDHNIAALVCDGAFSTAETLVALMKRWASIFARVRLVYENHPEGFWRLLVWLLMCFAQPKLGRRFPSVKKAMRDMQSRPILLIHGQRDSYIRADHARSLFDQAPEPKELWIVPDAKHNQSVVTNSQEYARRTVNFFLRHLAGEQGEQSYGEQSEQIPADQSDQSSRVA